MVKKAELYVFQRKQHMDDKTPEDKSIEHDATHRVPGETVGMKLEMVPWVFNKEFIDNMETNDE